MSESNKKLDVEVKLYKRCMADNARYDYRAVATWGDGDYLQVLNDFIADDVITSAGLLQGCGITVIVLLVSCRDGLQLKFYVYCPIFNKFKYINGGRYDQITPEDVGSMHEAQVSELVNDAISSGIISPITDNSDATKEFSYRVNGGTSIIKLYGTTYSYAYTASR